jgi:hypothetical protein
VSGDESLRREAFFLAYHLHWSYPDVMDLPTDERRSFVRLLGDQLESEQAALRSAGRR